jgi:Protein of unknown function (DUF1360)
VTVPDWWAVTLLALAAYRLFHLVAKDTILNRPRAWVLRAGDWRPGDNALMPVGFRTGLADFISCPWCTGFWISGALVTGWYVAADYPFDGPAIYGWVLTWLAVSALVGLIASVHDLSDRWNG